ncbi:MAG: amidohydrolase family protein, partial [Acidimicrobiales bacterium]
TNPVFAELAGGSLEARREAYASAEWRQRARDAWADDSSKGFRPRWSTMEIAEAPSQPDIIGKRILDLAEEGTGDPFDALLDATLGEPDLMVRIKVILANDDVEGVTTLLQDEHTTIGLSDAGAHVGQLCDAPQATDLLGNWVRDRQVLSLEQAVRKLTGQQADLFAFEDRGYLRPGAWADVTVFDPETIDPGPVRRVRDFPADSERLTADAPVGMRHVIVNGHPIQVDGDPVPADELGRPGHLVKPAPRN